MTRQEYQQKKRECLFDFCREHGYKITPNVEGFFGYAFDRAYALGKQESKQESKQETVIQGWVARDAGGFISLFSYCPDRVMHDNLGFWGHNDGSDEIDLPKNAFPDLTWDDDPIEVELIIKRKKNG